MALFTPKERLFAARRISKVALIGSFLFGFLSIGSASRAQDLASTAPEKLNDGWTTASPEDAGLDPCVLESMTIAIKAGKEFSNAHSVLIVKDGKLVYEEYFTGKDRRWRGNKLETVSLTFDRDTLHDTRSAGKSITSAVVGIAVGSGAITSLDAPLVSYFPEHPSLNTPQKRQITLRHALTMSAGLDWNEVDVPYTNSANDAERMHRSRDPAKFVFARQLKHDPGSTWCYNSGLPTLLGMAVSRATKRPFGEYVREVLFKPLGITNVEWGGPTAWAGIEELRWVSSEPWAKVAAPGGALWIRPRDLAKFGFLYLNSGRWNGRQVLPADWVRESTQRRIAVKDAVTKYGKHGYGYLWWHDRFNTPEGELVVHTAVGNGEQKIFVIPALNMVVVHFAGRYNDESAYWMSERLLLDYIVSAARKSSSEGPNSCASDDRTAR